MLKEIHITTTTISMKISLMLSRPGIGSHVWMEGTFTGLEAGMVVIGTALFFMTQPINSQHQLSRQEYVLSIWKIHSNKDKLLFMT